MKVKGCDVRLWRRRPSKIAPIALVAPIRFPTVIGALILVAVAVLMEDVSAQSSSGAGKRTTSPVYTTWHDATVLRRSLIRNEYGINTGKADAQKVPFEGPTAELLATGLEGGSGSAIGLGGALYVTEANAGRISRVDPLTGEITTFARGLPKRIQGFPFGGVVDVVFIGKTAYALVTLVGLDVGGSAVVGIYRVDGPDSFTVVAEIGEFSLRNPPTIPFEFFVPTGAQYALDAYRGGFLVTDGHLNRVLRVSVDGEVSELIGFGNIVPTGLAVSGNTLYMALAGPVPHLPQDGKVVSFGPKATTVTQVASGARLLVDVEFGRGRLLYALSQGVFPVGEPDGSPALPGTGALVEVNGNGTFTVVMDGLNQPTSLEFIGSTAYVVTYGGEIWKIEGVSGPPYGVSH